MLTIVSLKSASGRGSAGSQDGGACDGEELFKIGFSDGSFFWFKQCYLPQRSRRAAEGDAVCEGAEAAFRFAASCFRAEKAAARLVARAEQSVFGLKRKLELRGHDPRCAEAAVSRLAALGLVDDARFAALWLRSKIGKAQSPVRLLAALRGRRIGRADAQNALRAVLDEDGEFDLLSRFAEKQKKPAADERALKRLLKNEGFSTAAIERFLEVEPAPKLAGLTQEAGSFGAASV